MLSKKILKDIKNKKITSRRQVYKLVGRSKRLLQWMNTNNILTPVRWDKSKFKTQIKTVKASIKKLPLAVDVSSELLSAAQRLYGSWNNALIDVFGEVNQRKHSHLSNKELLNLVLKHIKKFSELPLRDDFNGQHKHYPYWEVYNHRFNLSKWSEVFKLLDLSNIKVYNSRRHGYGKIFLLNGEVFLSRQEYLIGKYLTENNIKFDKEVPYGNSSHIFDFYLPTKDLYIEYYGIATEDYKARIKEKQTFYGDRNVLEIYKHENTINKLASKVQRL
ncbi:hypothetical protein H8D85_01125 [bacterium]|nr:hypothetical protein [bacterium]